MKSFKFSLARMRDYKEQILDKEKGTLRLLNRQLDEIRDRIAVLKRYQAEKHREFAAKQQEGIKAHEIKSYQVFFESARIQLEQLAEEAHKAEEAVERQLKVVIAASQDVSGLNKLEEKQLEEYQLAASKAGEQEIAEFISSRMIRERIAEQ